MSRQKLIEEVKLQGGAMSSGGVASQAVDAVFAALGAVVERGDDVVIRGFGKFAVKDRAGRKGRNPRTGEEIAIQPRRVLVFTDRRQK